jgi:hypothetical protein
MYSGIRLYDNLTAITAHEGGFFFSPPIDLSSYAENVRSLAAMVATEEV